MTDAATMAWPPAAAVAAPGLPRLLPPPPWTWPGTSGPTVRCATPGRPAADRGDPGRRADRARRCRLSRRGQDDRGRRARRGGPSRPATAPRGSPPAARTGTCCGWRRTSCSTGCSSPPRRSAPGAPSSTCTARAAAAPAGHALAERSAAGCDQIAAEIVAAPPRFLAGEESALASAGQRRARRARVQAAPGVRARRRRRAHAGAERRDAGPRGAHRAVRGGLVPPGRHRGRAGKHAGHRAPRRRRQPGHRGAGRRAAGRGARAGPPARPGGAGRRLSRGVDPGRAGRGAAAGQCRAAPGGRLAGRGRARRAAAGPVRPGRDRAGAALPRGRVGRPVRAVPRRPAPDGAARSPSCPGPGQSGLPGGPGAMVRAGRGARRVPPPGRDRAAGAQRARRVQRRDRAAPVRAVHGRAAARHRGSARGAWPGPGAVPAAPGARSRASRPARSRHGRR